MCCALKDEIHYATFWYRLCSSFSTLNGVLVTPVMAQSVYRYLTVPHFSARRLGLSISLYQAT